MPEVRSLDWLIIWQSGYSWESYTELKFKSINTLFYSAMNINFWHMHAAFFLHPSQEYPGTTHGTPGLVRGPYRRQKQTQIYNEVHLIVNQNWESQ